MGKATKTNRKRYEIKLSLPDQKHMSYLSDGHAISNSAKLAKNEPFQNFEGYLLDAIFARANQDIGQYAAYLKKQKEATELNQIEDAAMDKTYEVEHAQEDTGGKSEADTTAGGTSEDADSTGLEAKS